MNRYTLKLGICGVGIFFLACSVSVPSEDYKPRVQDTEFLHRSVKQVSDVIVHDIFSPVVASRIYSYMSVAGYEAAIAGDPQFVSLAGQLHGFEAVPKPEEGQE